MSKKILQKCVDELKKESPNIPYIQGILETLIEMDPEKDISAIPLGLIPRNDATTVELFDEVLTDEDRAYATKMSGGRIAPLN